MSVKDTLDIEKELIDPEETQYKLIQLRLATKRDVVGLLVMRTMSKQSTLT